MAGKTRRWLDEEARASQELREEVCGLKELLAGRKKTPLAELHDEPNGLTFHQATPLRQGGITAVERLAELVDEYRANPDGSTLAGVPRFGPTRLEKVCAALNKWKAES